MYILEAEKIRRVFEGSHGSIEVLTGLDMAVREGEVIVIIGASGAGKSTLLYILGTLDSPDGGRILIRGENPMECSSRELDEIRNRDIGFVFQFHYLLPEFDALENVMMPAAVARALMNSPAIVLADEPSGNLDEKNSETLHSLIKELSRTKKQTFIIVTHKRELLSIADRALHLHGGRLTPIEG